MKKLVLFMILAVLAASVGFSGCAGTGDKTVEVSPASSAAPFRGVSFDGRWTGSVEMEGYGTVPMGYDFISDGNNLTGTTDGQSGKIPIDNGKIDGNKIKFDVTINLNGQDILVNYSGVLTGDKLKLSWPGMGGTQEVTCTKQ